MREATPVCVRMPTPTTETFAKVCFDFAGHARHLAAQFFDDQMGGLDVVRIDRETQVGRFAAFVNDLDDVVDDHLLVGDVRKDFAGEAGLVGDADEFDAGEVFLQGRAANDHLAEIGGFLHDVGSFRIGVTAADADAHVIILRQLDAARMHDLSAERCQFQHFVVENVL